jgi:hypothetical protein
VEGIEPPRELVAQRASAAAAGARRQLRRERGLAHVAQWADAAGVCGLFDVAPLRGVQTVGFLTVRRDGMLQWSCGVLRAQ